MKKIITTLLLLTPFYGYAYYYAPNYTTVNPLSAFFQGEQQVQALRYQEEQNQLSQLQLAYARQEYINQIQREQLEYQIQEAKLKQLQSLNHLHKKY